MFWECGPHKIFWKSRLYMCAVFLLSLLIQFLEIFRKQYQKMLLFFRKWGLLILSLIRKIMENKNFKHVYVWTMIFFCFQIY